MHRFLIYLTLAAVALAAAPAALAKATHWSNLKSVTVKLQRTSPVHPQLPIHTTVFSSRAQVAKATAALNANHIARGNIPNHTGVCIGGTNVTIRIEPKTGGTVTLNGYHCGKPTYGTIAGNVPGFIKAVGLKLS